MTVIPNQHLWLDNVLSYRTRVELKNLSQLIGYIKLNMEALKLKLSDDLLFAVTEVIKNNDLVIIGAEFLIPVDKQTQSSCHFIFKPKFRLENALMLKYQGNISDISSVKGALYEHAINNDKDILTNVYYQLKQLDGEKAVINAYVGVNGNVL